MDITPAEVNAVIAAAELYKPVSDGSPSKHVSEITPAARQYVEDLRSGAIRDDPLNVALAALEPDALFDLNAIFELGCDTTQGGVDLEPNEAFQIHREWAVNAGAEETGCRLWEKRPILARMLAAGLAYATSHGL